MILLHLLSSYLASYNIQRDEKQSSNFGQNMICTLVKLHKAIYMCILGKSHPHTLESGSTLTCRLASEES